MNTESSTPTNALEGNGEFVAYLHENARREKIPGTCNKVWLASVWRKQRFSFQFTRQTGKRVLIPNIPEFFQQAAELYRG